MPGRNRKNEDDVARKRLESAEKNSRGGSSALAGLRSMGQEHGVETEFGVDRVELAELVFCFNSSRC